MAVALGVAWSPAAAALPDLGHLVDYIEAPGWALDDLTGPPVRRKVLHNLDQDFSLATEGVIDCAWGRRTLDALRRIDSPWFSLHLGFSTERVRFVKHMLPDSPLLTRELLFERIVANVHSARRHLGHRPFLLENLDYCPEGAYEHICDPAFISDVLVATDTELLLDLAHLRVTASWFGVDPFEMLIALPLDRVFEVHISGPRPLSPTDARLDDIHDTLTDEDLALLRHVLTHTQARAITLEYRRDAQVLREQLLLLARATGRVWRGVGC